MSREKISRLIEERGHIVGFRPYRDQFGTGFRAECLDCDYVSPVLSWPRANAVAREHTAKSVGAWKPAR